MLLKKVIEKKKMIEKKEVVEEKNSAKIFAFYLHLLRTVKPRSPCMLQGTGEEVVGELTL